MSHKNLQSEVEAWLGALGEGRVPQPAFIRFEYDSGFPAISRLLEMGFVKVGSAFGPGIRSPRKNVYNQKKFYETEHRSSGDGPSIRVITRIDSTRRPYYSTMRADIIEENI